jgi:hypothetical protein
VNFVLPKELKCHISSTAALGGFSKYGNIITEKQSGIQKNRTVIMLSKYGAEMEIWRGQQEGLDVIIVNPGIMWPWIPRTGKRPTLKLLTDYGITPWEKGIRRG